MRSLKYSMQMASGSLWQLVRFGIVGAVATSVYVFVAISLPALPSFSASPTVASSIASFVSVLVSYFGHHKVTFSKVGRHEFYLPRFLLSSTALSCIAAAATYLITETLRVDYRFASLCVAFAYPAASFLLGRIWIFRDVR
ncbi:GtrA family protein [Rhodoblastus sp.]|uniref:GtrA family protein n=1 Tax=Rhodoblastus sp. TaxID=1962975 RepID=UPI003F947475